MTTSPAYEALDICCCQGAASAGLARAGFLPTGVDIDSQPRYPYRFVRADAVAYLRELIRTGEVRRYAFLWLSPPCQSYTLCQRIQSNDHPQLIEPLRELAIKSGLPYVIENVPGAPLIEPVELCGAMFPGLNTYRHRLFEANFPVSVPEHPEHVHPTVKMGRPLRDGDWYHAVGNFSNVPYVRENMGVPWMTREGIRECIPPLYAEHFGRQALQVVSGRLEHAA